MRVDFVLFFHFVSCVMLEFKCGWSITGAPWRSNDITDSLVLIVTLDTDLSLFLTTTPSWHQRVALMMEDLPLDTNHPAVRDYLALIRHVSGCSPSTVEQTGRI